MNINNAVFTLDTLWTMSGDYTAEVILGGHFRFDTPLFDSLAADRFANDRATKVENPAERRNHEFDRLDNYEEFNLGDYR